MAAHQIISEGVEAAIGGGVESISMTPRSCQSQSGTAGTTARVSTWSWATPPKWSPSATRVSRRGAGRVLAAEPAAHRPRAAGRFFRRRDRAHESHRAILDKKTGEVVGKEEVCCDHDECNRPDTTLEGLLALKPHFDPRQRPGHSHGRQFFAAFRWRFGHAAHVAPARRSAGDSLQAGFPRFSGGRLRAGRNGHRSGLRRSETAASAPA